MALELHLTRASLAETVGPYCFTEMSGLTIHTGCGVFILSLDQEPAKTCQRLKPGDEVIAVDGKSLIGRTHFECMQALREVQGIGTLTVHSTH